MQPRMGLGTTLSLFTSAGSHFPPLSFSNALSNLWQTQVFLQFTIFDLSGEILLSTRPECGGPGNPIPYVLAKGSARPLRGVELALANMKLKERCMLQLKPEYAYLHPECKIDPPPGLRKDDPVKMDVQLYAWESAVKAHPVGADGATKLIVAEGTGWETPRPPFKVELEVSARWAAPSGGAESSVAPYFPGGGDSTAPKLSCNLGAGALPPALEAAVGSMMRGERAKVLCPVGIASGGGMIPAPPASLAEGDPRFAALRYVEFDVTLVDFSQVRDLTGDGGATKCTLRKGRGDFPADCPLEDTTLQARIRVRRAQTALNGSNGSTSGETGDRDASEPANWLVLPGADASGKVEVDTGMGSLPEPVESALRLMLRDELALVTSDWAHSYGGREGDAPAGLPSGSDLEFEVELLDFQAEVNHHELGADDKLDKADTWREQGNILFKQGKYLLARQKYHKAMKCAGQALDLETQEQFDRAKRAKVSCLLNLAACAQKQEAYGEAITWCDKAIK